MLTHRSDGLVEVFLLLTLVHLQGELLHLLLLQSVGLFLLLQVLGDVRVGGHRHLLVSLLRALPEQDGDLDGVDWSRVGQLF